MDTTLSKKLETLIDSNIDKASLPYVKGNSIRIKHIVIRKNKIGWLLYDTDTNTQIAQFFCRSSALAYANVVLKKRASLKQVFELDKTIEKHYNDCMFYLHTMKVTKDETRREAVKTRYDISYATTRKATKDLERIIMF